VDVVDTIVVGAGVVGLAVGRALAATGKDTLVMERHGRFGEETSSRNSGVVHSGIYYPTGSLKARLCVRGRELLYEYSRERGISHRRCGKLIVAQRDQIPALQALHAKALENGVADLRWLDSGEARELEPAVTCAAALLSPATGIIDVHEWMNALLSDVEAHGGVLVLNTSVQRVRPSAFGESWRLMRLALGILDEDRVFLNLSPKGEPRLGSRGLFADAERLGLFWILYFFPMAGTVCSTLPNGHTCRSGNFARGPGALRSAVY